MRPENNQLSHQVQCLLDAMTPYNNCLTRDVLKCYHLQALSDFVTAMRQGQHSHKIR